MSHTKILPILAYLLLACACAFAIKFSSDTASNARGNLTASAKQAVMVSCEADRSTAKALRTALEAQKVFVKDNPEPPPPTTQQRLGALDDLIASIIVPDCKERAALITEEDAK